MKIIPVSVGAGYTVFVGADLLSECGALLRPLLDPCNVVVVTDSTVAPLYAPAVQKSLDQSGYSTSVFSFAAGEASKTMETLSHLLEFMAARQLTRSDYVVALGGGVVGDLAGFAAGCYMRGIRYVQLPTTLLAAVDSSVGGKTGLNLAAGKNLAGLFWQPSAVICDTTCLATLPDEIFLDGVAEAVKVSILGDRELFSRFERGVKREDLEAVLEDIITRCVEFKARVVGADEREGGVRKILNLGHTLGHALEACSDYTVAHGHAVATGIALITQTAAALGYCNRQEAHRIVQLLSGLGLPVTTKYPTESLVRAALHDKKRSGSHLTLVLPTRIGSYRLHEVCVDDLQEILEKGRGEAV